MALRYFRNVDFANIVQVVHLRKDPLRWAVFTSPFFFLIAGTICTLSVVYKGSPNLGLDKRPAWFIASVTLGVGFGLFVLSGLFFVPYVHCKVIKRDYTLRLWDIWQGPALFSREPPEDASAARVPNYAVVQHDGEDDQDKGDLTAPGNKHTTDSETSDKSLASSDNEAQDKNSKFTPESRPQLEEAYMLESPQAHYRLLLKKAELKHHAELREKKGPLGWVSLSAVP